MVLTYDPNEISVIVGGKIMSGFADGTFVKFMRNEQAFNLKVGVDGIGTRAKTNNKSGKLEITLMQSSPSNDDLTAFTLADELNNQGVVPILLKDSNGTTLISAATAWVQKFPDTEFAKEVTTRVWTIETDSANVFVGGNH